jgi:hypothetical protein
MMSEMDEMIENEVEEKPKPVCTLTGKHTVKAFSVGSRKRQRITYRCSDCGHQSRG